MSIDFPDPKNAGPEGLVYIGGDLSVETLINAYSKGIFPWPHQNLPLLWFSPDPRGVLDFKDLHQPKSFKKFIKKNIYTITKNKNFSGVIEGCARVPRAEQGTWINKNIIRAYINLHKAGYAHSVECWQGINLVGGIYGVWINDCFSGESMFYLKSHASKVALLGLIEWLKESGHQWMDTQMVTPILAQFGGKLIPRTEFLKRLGI